MSQILIIQLNPEELKALIREALAENKSLPVEDRILTVIEAAEYLKVSDGCIYTRIADRSIPHFKRGKRIYFRQSELDKWLAEGKQATKNEILAEE